MYLLDANVMIQGKNAYYGMDIVPGFWQWIEKAHGDGLVFTVSKVADEIKDGGDELADWIKALPTGFALDVSSSTATSLAATAAWASAQTRYVPAALAEFLSVADYYLVAQAHDLGFIVVTHETPAPDGKKRIKIPDACNGLGVAYTTPWAMLRNEGARFVS
ncbi:protein of unknown function [Geodermatophilus saharensis]|uniref:PIN domain-containing protein n=1 Tax=Geodermatophilus saharensis TaxID=1137994 RepID=A0A239FCA4_9ACTN|nr:DUF4411 family protein [Geodermatophilus saharensis]SNS54361.1 protein of unknown function [Geodermatophilus saharensis]